MQQRCSSVAVHNVWRTVGLDRMRIDRFGIDCFFACHIIVFFIHYAACKGSFKQTPQVEEKFGFEGVLERVRIHCISNTYRKNVICRSNDFCAICCY